jgi:RHS repeat-associated protein
MDIRIISGTKKKFNCSILFLWLCLILLPVHVIGQALTIEAPPPLTMNLGDDPVSLMFICESAVGSTVTLSADYSGIEGIAEDQNTPGTEAVLVLNFEALTTNKGTHTVTISAVDDAATPNQATIDYSFTVTSDLTAAISDSDTACEGSEGTIYLVASGGMAPYTIHYHLNGTASSQLTVNDTVVLNSLLNTTVSIDSVVDAQNDKTEISDQTGYIVIVPNFEPEINADRNGFLRSVCSGSYVHAPVSVQSVHSYNAYEWLVFDGDEFVATGDYSPDYQVEAPGIYQLAVVNEQGCQGASTIDLSLEETTDLNNLGGLICNGNFENNEILEIPFLSLFRDSVLACGERQVEGDEVNTDFYGFEFNTSCRYANYFSEGLPMTFTINDSLLYENSEDQAQVLFPLLPDTAVAPYGGSDNILFMKGRAGNGCDDGSIPEWTQSIDLIPNTNYLLTFYVASIADTGTNDVSPPVIDFGIKDDVFLSFINNSYYLNANPINVTEYSIDTATTVKEWVFGDSVRYEYIFERTVVENNIMLTQPLRLTQSQRNGGTVWYKVSCRFGSRNLTHTNLSIRNTGVGSAYNIIAIDNIDLIVSNISPSGGSYARILAKMESQVDFGVNEADLLDTLTIQEIAYTTIPNFSHTLKSQEQRNIIETFTWFPTQADQQEILIRANDGKGVVTLPYVIRACWDYDLAIEDLVTSSLDDLYAGSDTINIQCTVANRYLYENTKDSTKAQTNFRIDLEKTSGEHVYNVYSQAIGVMQSGETIPIDTSFVFPKDLLEAGGEYRLTFYVDKYDKVTCENNDENNIEIRTINFTQLYTDLELQNLEMSTTSLLPGVTELNYSFDLRNLGTIPRSILTNQSVTVKVYIVGSNGQKLLLNSGSVIVPRTGQAESFTNQTLILPNNLFVSDSYSLLIIADEDREVTAETVRSNNELNIPVEILEHIEFTNLNSVYTFPATDPFIIDFSVADNNVGIDVDVTFSGNDLVTRGLEFTEDGPDNIVHCQISWTPEYDDISQHSFTINAVDDLGHTSSRTVILNITDTPPVIDSIGNHADTIPVMVPFSFGIKATDRTINDSISFSIGGVAAEEFDAQMEQVTYGTNAIALFKWTPDYNAQGVYRTTIYANDIGGLKDSITFDLVVKGLPNSTFTYVSRCDTNMVTLKASGDGAVYTWNFGDGKSLTTTQRQITHTYEEPGKYQVTLNAKAEGVEHSTSKYIEAGSQPAFFATKDVCAGETSTFSNVTEGGTNYTWDFGDGNKSYDINPVHKYQSDKDTTFNCSLTVQVGGCQSSYTQPIKVLEGVEAVILSSDGGNMVCEGTEITFDGSSSDGAITYLWNFDDEGSSQKNRSREAHISHLFSEGGSFKVQLTVTNGRCRDEEVHYVTVEPRPQLSIEGPDYFCEGNSVVLTGRINNVSQSNFFDYRWLNEVDSIIGFNRTILAGEEGTYKLIIANTCGISDTATFSLKPLYSPVVNASLISGITCSNLSDGEAQLEINRRDTAEAPYIIEWAGNELETSDTLFTLTNLKKGRNYISVANSIGCMSTTSVDVPDNGPIFETATKPSGCNVDIGQIQVIITGGATPFEVSWYGPLTDSVDNITDTIFELIELPRGRYNLQISDNNGCEMTAKNLVISSPAISIDVPVEESCGDDPVHIAVQVSMSNTDTSDQTPPDYSYDWFEYDTVKKSYESFSAISGKEGDLAAGLYMVHVSESNYGCLDSAKFDVAKGFPLTAAIEGESPLCYDDSTGSFKVNVTGNTGTVSYKWTTDSDTTGLAFGPRFENVPSGNYIAWVSDERGCSDNDEITVTEPEKIKIDNFIGNICSATVDISPDNSYTYSWIRLDSINGSLQENTIQTTVEPLAIGLSQGEYYVMARNADGCTGKTTETGVIEGRTEPRTFGIHYAFKNPDEEPQEEEAEEEDVTQIVADMKVSITASVSSCKANIENDIQDFYEDLCFSGKYLNDAMEIEYVQPYYHYTLYYYDRANNLTRTVPPEGVNLLDPNEISAIVEYRKSETGTITDNNHNFTTTYNYNGLNQLVNQNTPDAHGSDFIYDHIARLRFSQNAQQAIDNQYSYTKYDELSRIIEVGQASTFDFEGLQAEADNPSFPETGTNNLTITVYTDPASGVSYYGTAQRFLNNRVSYSFTDIDGDTLTKNDQSRTYYSYDPHGNVEWLVQDIPGIGKNYIKYTYDLISGNVLEVVFNEYRSDRFYHKYTYDEDNRILAVYTSTNGVNWDNDASYQYYAHGPLRRMEIGEDKIQGVDYTYTIQGWLKAINSPALTSTDDPGGDGSTNNVASDIFGMSLGYFKGDFKRTKNGNPLFGHHNISGTPNLYNGNISSWAAQTKPNEVTGTYNDRMTAQAFRYDKLNRIKESKFFYDQGGWYSTDLYKTNYTYDLNGNLLTLQRNSGDASNLLMDDLGYDYESGTNKLTELKDLTTIGDNGLFGDVAANSEQVSHRYTYDEIGNLVRDEGYEKLRDPSGQYKLNEVITTIGWNVYGKIDSITILRKPLDEFDYDTTRIKYMYASDGNRIVKDLYEHNTKPENRTTTFYVRDASGNIMGTYQRENILTDSEYDQYLALFTMTEQPVYGSSRLGVRSGGGDTLFATDFTPGDNKEIEITTKPDEGKAGMFNWITSALRKVKLGDETELCDCKVRNVNFGSGSFASESDAVDFMGYAKNNVTLAEDFNGQVLFFSVVAEDYFGNKNVCLVFDKQGMLMKNSYGINSSAKGKPMVIKAQGETNKYYLVTIGEDHKPYYHIIDMAQLGYGRNYTAGAVTAKNIPIDNSTLNNYGYHMSVIEDNTQRKSLVYMTRYIEPVTPGLEGQTELVVFDFVPNAQGTLQAEVLTSVSGFDKYGEGELQLSPQGNRLAYYNRKRGIAGFAHQEVELHVFGLGRDRKSIDSEDTLSIQGSTAGTAGKSSIEFASENMLLFTQDGLYLNNETFTERAIWSYRFDTKEISMLPVPVSGDIRRGIDDEIYVAAKGSDNKLYRLKNLLTQPEADSTAGLYSNTTGYAEIMGGLPMQAYRIAPVGQGNYARRIGQKNYELTDHLGNVRAVVSDSRLGTFSAGSLTSTVDVSSYNNYYPFGMLQPGRHGSSEDYRFGFNGMENENEFTGKTGSHLDFGARIYDSRVGRWLSVDPLANKYPFASPYNFALNTPIQAIDPDGKLVIFVNGLMMNQRLNADNRRMVVSHADAEGVVTMPNPNYRPYPTNEMSINGPTYLGKRFNYWGNIDDKFNARFNDWNNLYVSGSNLFSSEAQDRFKAGMKSGQELIAKIQSGEIKLAKAETIKLVGHSQGAAHAAGMAKVLNQAYNDGIINNAVEQIYYLAPHQATEINSPKGVFSVQYMRRSDKVSSTGIVSSELISGGSNFGRINGVTEFKPLSDWKGDQGGHYVYTYSEIFKINSSSYGGVATTAPSGSRFVVPKINCNISIPNIIPVSDNTKVAGF